LPTGPPPVKLLLYESIKEADALPAARPAPKRVRRPQRVRDFQRSRVYRWEADHVLPHDRKLMSLDACRALVGRVFAERQGPDQKPPRVEDGRGRRHAAGSRDVIKLPRWARTRPIVLHECAHGLALDGHGPDFVRAYVELLVDFLGFERADLERSLVGAGIRISPPGRPIAAPAMSGIVAPVRLPRSLALRLVAIGVRTLGDLRAIGPVQAWVRLRRCFGQIIGQGSLLTLAAAGMAKPAEELDGRTRAELKFEATRQLLEANGRPKP
jgi:hypothetical protein